MKIVDAKFVYEVGDKVFVSSNRLFGEIGIVTNVRTSNNYTYVVDVNGETICLSKEEIFPFAYLNSEVYSKGE